ncbi:hypothetical protein ACU4GD_15100 [Cupriavidus basilensis]
MTAVLEDMVVLAQRKGIDLGAELAVDSAPGGHQRVDDGRRGIQPGRQRCDPPTRRRKARSPWP